MSFTKILVILFLGCALGWQYLALVYAHAGNFRLAGMCGIVALIMACNFSQMLLKSEIEDDNVQDKDQQNDDHS